MHYSNFRWQTYCYSKCAQFLGIFLGVPPPPHTHTLLLLRGYSISSLSTTGAHGSFVRDANKFFVLDARFLFFYIQFPCCRLGKQYANSLVCVCGGGGVKTYLYNLNSDVLLTNEHCCQESNAISSHLSLSRDPVFGSV